MDKNLKTIKTGITGVTQRAPLSTSNEPSLRKPPAPKKKVLPEILKKEVIAPKKNLHMSSFKGTPLSKLPEGPRKKLSSEISKKEEIAPKKNLHLMSSFNFRQTPALSKLYDTPRKKLPSEIPIKEVIAPKKNIHMSYNFEVKDENQATVTVVTAEILRKKEIILPVATYVPVLKTYSFLARDENRKSLDLFKPTVPKKVTKINDTYTNESSLPKPETLNKNEPVIKKPGTINTGNSSGKSQLHSKKEIPGTSDAFRKTTVNMSLQQHTGTSNKVTGELAMKKSAKKEYARGEKEEKPDEFASTMLKLHNDYREKHKAGPLMLDPELVKQAKVISKDYAKKDETYDADTPDYVCTALRLGNDNNKYKVCALDVFDSLLRNGEGYDFNKEPDNNSQDPYTQVIWKNSSQFGASKDQSKKTKKTYIALLYKPPGNRKHQYVKNCK